MATPILGGLTQSIINPAIADVGGSIELGQQRQAAQQERLRTQQAADQEVRRTAAINELLKGTVSNKLGEKIDDLGIEGLQLFSNATGIPIDQKGRMKQFLGNAKFAQTAFDKGSVEDTQRLVGQRIQMLNAAGLDTPQMNEFLQELSTNPEQAKKNLDLFITATEEMIKIDKDKQKPFQKTGSFLVKDTETGETKLVTGAFNPNTNELTTSEATFGKDQIVSKLGETAAEQTTRKVSEATDKEQAKAGIELATADKMTDIIVKRKRKEKLTSQQTARLDNFIDVGINAMDQLSNVNRGLELLKTVSTGGLTANAKVVSDFFGTTSGDIGELNNILATNVLAGLANFKGALSDAEREFIARMETNITQGTEFNVRQLSRLQNTLQKKINIGKDAAQANEDEFSLNLFNDVPQATGFGGAPAPATQTQPAPATAPATQQRNIVVDF